VIELGKEGMLPVSMATRIGVAKDTLHEWARVHPEFSAAFTIARSFCEAFHLERGIQTAHGERQGNAPMTKFILSAAFGYRETAGVEHSGEIYSRAPVDPAAALAAAKQAEEAGEV
jgi:DNA-binding XRE family transcriptional regulator